MPVPLAHPWTAEIVRDTDGAAFLHYNDFSPQAALPDELVLRELFDLDADDPEALAAFTGRFGMLTTLGSDPFALLAQHHFPRVVPALRRAGEDFVERARLRQGFVASAEAAGLHVRCLRAVTRQWENHAAGDDAPEAVATAWEAEGIPLPKTDHAMFHEFGWQIWEEFVNAALRPCQVHVRAGRPDGDPWQAWGMGEPNAYTAMTVQLVNLVVEGAMWRRCASETCDHVFVRQRGRAAFDQHRTEGVRYCSRSCARAQANREWRRRQKQRKE